MKGRPITRTDALEAVGATSATPEILNETFNLGFAAPAEIDTHCGACHATAPTLARVPASDRCLPAESNPPRSTLAAIK